MLEGRVVDTLDAVEREAWNALFPGELENYDYLAAVEAAGLEGFAWRYVLVEEDGRLLAAAPGFVTAYPLDATLKGTGKRLVRWLGGFAPGLATLRLACLGSPCTETAQIGWSPDAFDSPARDVLTALLLHTFEQAAGRDRCGLLAVKDVPAPQLAVWSAVLAQAGYRAMSGLPSASLNVGFDGIGGYLATLSPGTRKDMRRKLRGAGEVRIEIRRDLDGLEDQVLALYAETRTRGDLQFETLTAAYFTGVLTRMGERAACVLYFVDEVLTAANLVLLGDGMLLDKFFCMSARGREYSLYFLSWFTNLQICLDHGLTRYDSGQAGYANKLRLGSRLTPMTLHFRHRNGLLNCLLRAVAPFLAPDGPALAPEGAQ
jgi:predicted N-acyltransferase